MSYPRELSQSYKVRERRRGLTFTGPARSADQRARTSKILVNFGKLFAAGLSPFAQTGSPAVRQVARQAPPVSFPIQQVTCACMLPLPFRIDL